LDVGLLVGKDVGVIIIIILMFLWFICAGEPRGVRVGEDVGKDVGAIIIIII